MGFGFYVCKRCGQVNSESDLGAHQDGCEKKKMGKAEIKERKKAIKKEFGDATIGMKMMAYFNSFWEAFDYWLEHYKEPETEEYKKNLAYVKLFLSGSEWVAPKQTEADIKTAKTVHMPTNCYEMYTKNVSGVY